jgi:D-sedoheptulose 7-phosphate isomerase
MSFPTEYKSKLLSVLNAVDIPGVEQAIDTLARAREENRQIFVCGNGGSAATANHFACDMVKGASYGRRQRFRIMALSEQIATLTAYANDVGYEHVFAEQLKNFARPGDVLMALSGSGNSPNVIQAVEYANSAGCYTIGLSGRDGGKLAPLVNLSIHVNEPHMGRIEDAHMVICHMICYFFMDTESTT